MQNPMCPNCGRAMTESRTLPRRGDGPETHVFKCSQCKVDFITEDHVPISGKAPR